MLRSRMVLLGVFASAVCCVTLGSPTTVDAQCADADADTICDDVDNCPNVTNPDQANTFGGPAGDACEHQNKVAKLKIKTGTAASPKGRISARGFFILAAGEQFLATSNISVRVFDGFETDVTDPAADGTNTDGLVCVPALNRIKCRGAMPLGTVVFKFGPPDATGAKLVSWNVKLAKLATPQIPSEPVTVIITDVVQDLPFGGVIHDCRASNGKLTCKEF